MERRRDQNPQIWKKKRRKALIESFSKVLDKIKSINLGVSQSYKGVPRSIKQ